MELTQAVRDFLNEQRFGIAATIGKDGVPQQTVVWFELQGVEVLMNTARGRVKDLNLRRDPRMSLCVEDGYRYVTLRGRVTIDEANAQRDIERLIARYEGPERAREMVRTQFAKEHRVSFRLQIERISGIGL